VPQPNGPLPNSVVDQLDRRAVLVETKSKFNIALQMYVALSSIPDDFSFQANTRHKAGKITAAACDSRFRLPVILDESYSNPTGRMMQPFAQADSNRRF
jgi:hypothetical protein